MERVLDRPASHGASRLELVGGVDASAKLRTSIFTSCVVSLSSCCSLAFRMDNQEYYSIDAILADNQVRKPRRASRHNRARSS